MEPEQLERWIDLIWDRKIEILFIMLVGMCVWEKLALVAIRFIEATFGAIL